MLMWGLLCSLMACAQAYKVGEVIPVVANRVGPYHNPTESYQYYNLPFCLPPGGKLEYKLLDLGEVSAITHASTPTHAMHPTLKRIHLALHTDPFNHPQSLPYALGRY